MDSEDANSTVSLNAEPGAKTGNPKAPTYTCVPLSNPAAIRLIKLHSLSPEVGPREHRVETRSPLRINLIVSELSTAPVYTAISYTWGKAPTWLELPMPDDNGFLLISKHAHDILQRLRPETEDGPAY
jgi:hypothetical protein